jgi:hypothetical protein
MLDVKPKKLRKDQSAKAARHRSLTLGLASMAAVYQDGDQCPHCYKILASSWSLKDHIRLHTGELSTANLSYSLSPVRREALLVCPVQQELHLGEPPLPPHEEPRPPEAAVGVRWPANCSTAESPPCFFGKFCASLINVYLGRRCQLWDFLIYCLRRQCRWTPRGGTACKPWICFRLSDAAGGDRFVWRLQ